MSISFLRRSLIRKKERIQRFFDKYDYKMALNMIKDRGVSKFS